MSGALRIGVVGGIPISIHVSWLAIYALISWSLAVGHFPAEIDGLGAAAAWASGLVAALLLFVSVLLHELSHAFVARAYGLGVRGITLHVFGGETKAVEVTAGQTTKVMFEFPAAAPAAAAR